MGVLLDNVLFYLADPIPDVTRIQFLRDHRDGLRPWPLENRVWLDEDGREWVMTQDEAYWSCADEPRRLRPIFSTDARCYVCDCPLPPGRHVQGEACRWCRRTLNALPIACRSCRNPCPRP